MLTLSFLERPVESLVAVATLLLGIPLYFLVFRGEPGRRPPTSS